MCGPLCAIGIAGGLQISRWLGINDLTLGLWIGALILSLSFQFNRFLIKKGWSFKFSFWLILILTFVFSFMPLMNDLFSGKASLYCGVPQIIIGAILGGLVLFLADKINDAIIKKHHNRVYFYYQRTIVPIIALILLSIFAKTIC